MLRGFLLSGAAGVGGLFCLKLAADMTGIFVAVNAASVAFSAILGLPGILTLLIVRAIC